MFYNRKEVSQFAKNWLESNQKFCKSFQTEIQKKTEKKKRENRKRLKGPGGRIRPATEGGPRPISLSLPEPLLFLSLSHRHLDPTCHPSQTNRLEHGAPERDLPGLFSDSG
jgi:hypothetical protein